MSSFILTRKAFNDIVEIVVHIADQSPEAALHVEADLYEAMDKLADMPGMGHLRDDLTSEPLRFWRVHSYLILYTPDTRPVEIVRVLSSSRDIGGILD
jgi:plasmid stabilization system protein ParE